MRTLGTTQSEQFGGEDLELLENRSLYPLNSIAFRFAPVLTFKTLFYQLRCQSVDTNHRPLLSTNVTWGKSFSLSEPKHTSKIYKY